MPFIKIKHFSVENGPAIRFTQEALAAQSLLAPAEFVDNPEAANSTHSTIAVSNLDTENGTKDITGTVIAPDRTEEAEIWTRQAPSGEYVFAGPVTDEGAFLATIPESHNKYRVHTFNYLNDVRNPSWGDELDIA